MLGSSRTIVQDGATAPCYDADFYPFGGEHVIANTCPQNYKFEGKERDAETGNDDFGARYYSSRFGRWLSADWSAVPAPVPYANLTNPQTLNLYAMVSDNPETFADLDGHGQANEGSNTNTGCNYTSNKCNDDQSNHDQNTSQKQSVAPTGIGYTNYNGQAASYVSTISNMQITRDADGNIVKTSETVTTAYFSTEQGHEGQFLGAASTSTTETFQAHGFSTGQSVSSVALSYGQARTIIGGAGVNAAIRSSMPDALTYFPGAVASDVRAHPLKYAGIAAEGVLMATPVPEAYEGVKAVVDVGLAAGHLAWDLTH